ncbi:MAG: HAMP domain-containing histidine kinase [Planctomycetes bacterium]|nr:HAMP domain-containing histidine kinase [Planctomycetota bacterium]
MDYGDHHIGDRLAGSRDSETGEIMASAMPHHSIFHMDRSGADKTDFYDPGDPGGPGSAPQVMAYWSMRGRYPDAGVFPVATGVAGSPPSPAEQHLIDNGIKYTQKGGLTINVHVKGRVLQIVIHDTGIGIPKEEQERLFKELFHRGRSAQKTNVSGRGIGLYVSHYIIKAHGGRIRIQSEGRNKGSTFMVELPLV